MFLILFHFSASSIFPVSLHISTIWYSGITVGNSLPCLPAFYLPNTLLGINLSISFSIITVFSVPWDGKHWENVSPPIKMSILWSVTPCRAVNEYLFLLFIFPAEKIADRIWPRVCACSCYLLHCFRCFCDLMYIV